MWVTLRGLCPKHYSTSGASLGSWSACSIAIFCWIHLQLAMGQVVLLYLTWLAYKGWPFHHVHRLNVHRQNVHHSHWIYRQSLLFSLIFYQIGFVRYNKTNMPCQCGYPDGMSPLGRMVFLGLRPRGKPSSLWETLNQDTHTAMAYLYNVACKLISNGKGCIRWGTRQPHEEDVQKMQPKKASSWTQGPTTTIHTVYYMYSVKTYCGWG